MRGGQSQTADKLNSLVAVSLHSYLTNGRAVHPKWQPRLVGRCLFVILTPFCKIPACCNFKILRHPPPPPPAHFRNATAHVGCLKNAAQLFRKILWVEKVHPMCVCVQMKPLCNFQLMLMLMLVVGMSWRRRKKLQKVCLRQVALLYKLLGDYVGGT